MATRSNYKTDQIDRSESARQRYDSNSTPANKAKLEDEQARTNRAMSHNAGAGRGSARPPQSRKWIEK